MWHSSADPQRHRSRPGQRNRAPSVAVRAQSTSIRVSPITCPRCRVRCASTSIALLLARHTECDLHSLGARRNPRRGRDGARLGLDEVTETVGVDPKRISANPAADSGRCQTGADNVPGCVGRVHTRGQTVHVSGATVMNRLLYRRSRAATLHDVSERPALTLRASRTGRPMKPAAPRGSH